jgi:hypothetical protein
VAEHLSQSEDRNTTNVQSLHNRFVVAAVDFHRTRVYPIISGGDGPIGVAKVQTSGRSLKHGITYDCPRCGLDRGQQANVQAGSRPIPVAVEALD